MNQLAIDTAPHRSAWAEMNGMELTKVPMQSLLHREMESPTEINRILNDPAIFEDISLPDAPPFDVAPLLADPRWVFLVADGGVIIFTPDDEPGSGIYEVHINFLESHRGRHAIEVVKEALRWIFTHTNCMFVQTRVPAFNRPAELLAKTAGGWLWFERKAAWPTKDGRVGLKFYAMSIYDWLVRRPKAVLESGKAFHARLEQEYDRLGFLHEDHADDEAHDLAVGACAEMMQGGEAEKGIILYNRWARVAGYHQINLISRNPLVIDIGEAMLHVLPSERTFKVIQCRSAQG